MIKKDGTIQCRCMDGSAADTKTAINVDKPDQDDFKDLEVMLRKNAKVKMLLRCNGIWIVNGKFGCTWKAEQIRITPTPGFEECSFLDDSDDEVDVSKIEDNFIQSDDDSDNDDDVNAEVQPEPEPTPTTKKPKKVRKAKRVA